MNYDIRTWQPIQWLVVITFIIVYFVVALNPWYYSLGYKTKTEADFIENEYVEPAYVGEDGTAYNLDNQMIDDYGNIIDERGNIIEEYVRPEPLEEDIQEEQPQVEEGMTVGDLDEEQQGVYGMLDDDAEVPLDYNGNPIYQGGQGDILEVEDPNEPKSLKEAWLREKGKNVGDYDPTLSEFEMLYKDGGSFSSLDTFIIFGYLLMLGYTFGLALTSTKNTIKYASPAIIGMVIKTIRIKWLIEDYKISAGNVLKWWGVLIMFLIVYYISSTKVESISEPLDDETVEELMRGNI